MKRRMAFVDLTNFKDWPAGGMLQYELAILPTLVKEFDVDIWGVSVDGKIPSSILLDDTEYPIKIWGNVKTKSKLIPNYWRGLSLIGKRNSFKEYDIIYVHTGSCATALSKVIDRSKTLLVYHQHGLSHLNDHSLMSLIQRPFVNYAQYVSDVVFVVSDKDAVDKYVSSISKKIRGRFVPVGSPIDLSLFHKITKENDEKIKLIYTGRIDSHKDVCTLIDMAGKLNSLYENFSLIIVGDGDEKEKVKLRVKALGLENKIVLTGIQTRKNVLQKLLNADIYVTASIGEGVSISVLEAYASGLPVVCFNVPGLSRQVINNVTGKVVNSRNVSLMAESVIDVKNNLDTYKENVLEEVKKYDSETISCLICETIKDSFQRGYEYYHK